MTEYRLLFCYCHSFLFFFFYFSSLFLSCLWNKFLFAFFCSLFFSSVEHLNIVIHDGIFYTLISTSNEIEINNPKKAYAEKIYKDHQQKHQVQNWSVLLNRLQWNCVCAFHRINVIIERKLYMNGSCNCLLFLYFNALYLNSPWIFQTEFIYVQNEVATTSATAKNHVSFIFIQI